jgi:hypothetical protein
MAHRAALYCVCVCVCVCIVLYKRRLRMCVCVCLCVCACARARVFLLSGYTGEVLYNANEMQPHVALRLGVHTYVKYIYTFNKNL